ncbi:site-specific DNA-methyltransferase [Acidovorax sp. BoFeN1]|uniref:site-specific DNA-methyltransferase n=1 Tax=Acidovorax sp. BoFeN1 TaxID=1231053 RepID=UPI000E08FE8E|nr:site-specific DNA-methyltransferase [Acidovorax sp. BoFeN1]RDD92789.1 site-specific DNA-methyltransferase [Acidovorax sp. BoFeN1]
MTEKPSPAKKPTEVSITRAKGRPMLSWVGKKPLGRVTAFPAQAIERFSATDAAPAQGLGTADWSKWPQGLPQGGLLYHGDNKEVLAHLLANGFRGQVKLIYIDPPFDSGADYVRKVQLRGPKGMLKIDGEDYALGEQVQYTDIWSNDNYLQFMYERLLMLKELLAEDGAIFLHCDPSKNSYLRLLMDEVFGPDNFVNEIVWQRVSAHSDAGRFGIIHDTIYYYGPAGRTWNPQRTELNQKYLEQFFDQVEESSGRKYSRSDLMASGLRNGETGKSWRGINPGERGNHWKVAVSTLEQWDAEGRIHWPKTAGVPRLKRYLDEAVAQGGTAQDIWTDLRPIHNQSQELLGYPTQKPENLIERIIASSSNPGDLVLDCFIGSGTTAAVAQKLGRRWIGCDINKGAIQTTAKRLQGVMREQAQALAAANSQGELVARDDAPTAPCQLSFSTLRVNDYDLHIQHNEAVELACQHLGLTRTRTDPFFDGTRGAMLAKIIPLNHPLTPLDLEALRTELKNRPEEERDMLVVSLGQEHKAREWVAQYNHNRPVNKIHLIELRTDRKAGGFIKHEPMSVQAHLERDGNTLVVQIDDVVSPSIIARLDLQEGIFRASIPDWRAVVDCVLIDTQHDGEVFNVALADVPARKQDLVAGRYELPAPPTGATVAVKLIDMLGEECVVRLHA